MPWSQNNYEAGLHQSTAGIPAVLAVNCIDFIMIGAEHAHMQYGIRYVGGKRVDITG
ncbi:hypothetical protein KDA_64150 [Dictyobacter alpinus]|uniref:Uncharacterized protein n=1 Tax=Dictyobacter alpinus TaxID=2014873 RepID=A0A402BHP0_9CHLR|nr:hypothetical protein KDA_64150 [Dictyobacter alpinus]